MTPGVTDPALRKGLIFCTELARSFLQVLKLSVWASVKGNCFWFKVCEVCEKKGKTKLLLKQSPLL